MVDGVSFTPCLCVEYARIAISRYLLEITLFVLL